MPTDEEITMLVKKIMELPEEKRKKVLKRMSNVFATVLMGLKDIQIEDMRLLGIIMNLYLEYIYINAIIRSEFKHPEPILNEFGFNEKCILIKALGLFDGQEGKKLLENVIKMNEIRNFYAHHLDTEIIPTNVKTKIDKMHLLAKRECKENDNFIEKYRCKVLSTFAELEKLSGREKKRVRI